MTTTFTISTATSEAVTVRTCGECGQIMGPHGDGHKRGCRAEQRERDRFVAGAAKRLGIAYTPQG